MSMRAKSLKLNTCRKAVTGEVVTHRTVADADSLAGVPQIGAVFLLVRVEPLVKLPTEFGVSIK